MQSWKILRKSKEQVHPGKIFIKFVDLNQMIQVITLKHPIKMQTLVELQGKEKQQSHNYH